MSVVPMPQQHRKDDDARYDALPNNLDVEQALLGTLLVHNRVAGKIEGVVKEDDFFEPLHRTIFKTAMEMIDKGTHADPVTIKSYLPDGDIGGITLGEYLARLCAESTSITNAHGYAEIIRDLSLRREGIALALEHVERLRNAGPADRIDDLINAHDDAMASLRPRLPDNGEFEAFDVVAQRALKKAADSYKADGKLTGIMSGLGPLDAAVGGFQPGDLIVAAGRPGMGKTALSAGIAINSAKALAEMEIQEGQERGCVGFLSLEMMSDQIAIRQLCEQASVMASKVRRNKITAEDFEKIDDQARALQKLPLFFDESSGLSINQATKKIRALHRKQPLRLVVVDYLQLMSGSKSRRNDSRVQDVTEITVGLKGLAKELGCPIIALSQLSRAVEQRDDKRPQLSDLRESGSIEQDADCVIFLFREEYYVQNQRPSKTANAQAWTDWEIAMEAVKGRAELIVAKNRHGAAGAVEVGFNAELMRFESEPPPAVEADDDDGAEASAVASGAEKELLKALFETIRKRGVPPPQNLPCLSSVTIVADYEDFKRAFRDKQAPDGLTRTEGLEGDDLAAATKERARELDTIKKALQRARGSLVGKGVIDTARAGADETGRAYIWHTGKPVRGMPETKAAKQPRLTIAAPAPADAAQEANLDKINQEGGI